jgi:hypothetical protein
MLPMINSNIINNLTNRNKSILEYWKETKFRRWIYRKMAKIYDKLLKMNIKKLEN